VNRLYHRQLWCLFLLLAGLSANPATRTDAVSAVQLLREGGCGGMLAWQLAKAPVALLGLCDHRARAANVARRSRRPAKRT